MLLDDPDFLDGIDAGQGDSLLSIVSSDLVPLAMLVFFVILIGGIFAYKHFFKVGTSRGNSVSTGTKTAKNKKKKVLFLLFPLTGQEAYYVMYNYVQGNKGRN